uniref:Serpentine receptor class gamma n=1 Tax=Rhabditophanes sp. KR3021 TaxID=114890 RepID=A0AC35THC5_9BILA
MMSLVLEKSFTCCLTFGVIFAFIPGSYHAVSPAGFVLTNNEYTNYKSIATFLDKPIVDVGSLSIWTLVSINGATSILTLMVNVLTLIYMKTTKKYNYSKYDTRLAMYSLSVFISQQTYNFLFYLAVFGPTEDKSIFYLTKKATTNDFGVICALAKVNVKLFNLINNSKRRIISENDKFAPNMGYLSVNLNKDEVGFIKFNDYRHEVSTIEVFGDFRNEKVKDWLDEMVALTLHLHLDIDP